MTGKEQSGPNLDRGGQCLSVSVRSVIFPYHVSHYIKPIQLSFGPGGAFFGSLTKLS